MKRIIISWLMAVGVWLTAVAANTITLTQAEGHPGDEVLIDVLLSGSEMPTAVELLVPLNDNVKYVDGSALLNNERSNSHSLTAAAKDGKLSIVIFSPSLAALKGSEGVLCSFKLKLGKEPADYALTPQVVMSNAEGAAMTATVNSGTVKLLSPKIEVTTPQIDFGHIPIRSVYTQNITLSNVGNETLEITGVTTDRSDLEAKTQNYSIAPGTSQSIELTYSPMVRGAIASQIKIVSNAINPKAGVAKVIADPFSVNELHVQRAEGIANEEVEVTLKMNNMEPIAGAQCCFKLPNELVYVEGSVAAGARCSGTGHQATAQIKNGELTLLLYSTTNSVIPEGDGELLTFRLRLNGPSGEYLLNPENVTLSNVAMENMVSATSGEFVVISSPSFSGASQLDMGESAVTEKQKASYTISNYGSVNLVINKIVFLSEGYSVEEKLPLTIAPWESKTINVSYIPVKEGKHNTTMQIYTNDPTNRMYSVIVSGDIYEPNTINVSGESTANGYKFAFGLDNYTDIVAVQMNIKWLPGMNTSKEQFIPTDRIKNHSYLLTDLGNGTYQVLIYSMNNTPLVGADGPLFTLDYTSTETLNYWNSELRVTDIVLSDSKGANYVSKDEVIYGIKPIPVSGISLDKTSVELLEGGTITLKATIEPSNATDKTVTWSTSDASIATVDNNGVVKGIKVGKVTITAKAGEKIAICEVTVNPVPVSGITLDKTSVELLEGGTITLKATVEPSNATDKTVAWSTSDASIATVDNNGVVKAIKVGKVTITAKAGDKTATCEVTVNPVPVSGITLNKTSVELLEGETITLKATIEPSNATDKTVTWSTSDALIATVDNNGVVKAIKVGKVTITAKAGDKTATCEVTVKPVPVSGITLDKTAAELVEGENLTIVATVSPDNATDKTVTWSTSDASIATVDNNGVVKAIKAGKVTITAEAGGLAATCEITVVGKETDGIDELMTSGNLDIYDIRGRLVKKSATSLDALPKGIYIVNGKKISVK